MVQKFWSGSNNIIAGNFSNFLCIAEQILLKQHHSLIRLVAK